MNSNLFIAIVIIAFGLVVSAGILKTKSHAEVQWCEYVEEIQWCAIPELTG